MDYSQIRIEDKSKQKYGLALSQISRCYIDGFSSILILEELLNIQKITPEVYVSNSYLFDHLYGIAYQSAVLNLSNIIINDNESINIHYLLSFFEYNYKTASFTEVYKKIQRNLRSLCNEFSEKSKIYTGVRELRDKYIAHIDKNRLYKCKLTSQKIRLQDIKKAYKNLELILIKVISDSSIDTELLNFEQINYIKSQLPVIMNKFTDSRRNINIKKTD